MVSLMYFDIKAQMPMGKLSNLVKSWCFLHPERTGMPQLIDKLAISA